VTIGRLLAACGLGALLLGTAAAATWKCVGNMSIVTAQAYIVPTACQATGTYTTGGDGFLSGPGVDLCNSAAKRPAFSLPTTAASATTGQDYPVLYLPTAGKMALLTAGSAPGAGVALVEVANGTAIDGATVVMLSFCQ
jgi:hypothetical protein